MSKKIHHLRVFDVNGFVQDLTYEEGFFEGYEQGYAAAEEELKPRLWYWVAVFFALHSVALWMVILWP